MTKGGNLKSTLIVTSDDLKVNGGRWLLQSGPAIRVRGFNSSSIGDRKIIGGDALPIYILAESDARVNGGQFLLKGGQPIQVTDVIGSARGVIQGKAIPVWPVDDDGNYDPNFLFSPTSISDLVLWLAGDLGLSLNDGDPIATWPDQSGNGNDATQGVGADQPIFRTGIINGLPIVQFDGVSDFLTISDITLSAFSVFFVLNTTIVPGGVQVILDNSDTNPPVNNGFWMGWDDRGPANPTDSYVSVAELATGVLSWFKDNSYGVAADKILTFQCSNDTNIFYSLDGVDQAPYDTGFAGTGAFVDRAATFGLGASRGGAFFTATDIAEAIVYNAVLSASDRSNVVNYLSNKYGISI